MQYQSETFLLAHHDLIHGFPSTEIPKALLFKGKFNITLIPYGLPHFSLSHGGVQSIKLTRQFGIPGCRFGDARPFTNGFQHIKSFSQTACLQGRFSHIHQHFGIAHFDKIRSRDLGIGDIQRFIDRLTRIITCQ
ncbi:hypothetical protein D3C81_861010 [compost metagenome]